MPSSQTSDTLDGMLRDARAELAAAKLGVARWQGVVAALEDAMGTVDAVAAVFTPEPAKSSMPIPRDAILAVMKEHPRVPMKLKQVLKLVHDAGTYDASLKAGDNSYGTALRRLAQNPDYPIRQAPDGGYYYNPDLEGLPLYAGPFAQPSSGERLT